MLHELYALTDTDDTGTYYWSESGWTLFIEDAHFFLTRPEAEGCLFDNELSACIEPVEMD